MKEIKLNNLETKITHPDKILFPKIGITKINLAQYYLGVSERLLPNIKDRPLTIHCFPDGIESRGFFRQHAPANLPEWFETFTLKTQAGGKMKHMLCQNKETLVYLANQNTIEIHRWLSKVDNPNQPDIMIIDIDPPENGFALAVTAAKLLKDKLKKKGHKASPMLTGSKGIHLISRLENGESYKQIKAMLYELTTQLSKEQPYSFSTEVRKEKREGMTYLDISRNSYGQTAIAPFSPRAKANASVATPISWNELDTLGLRPDSYTICNSN